MRQGSSSVQIEANTLTRSKTSTLGPFGPHAMAKIDQSGTSYDPLPPFAIGMESLAVSLEAASLKRRAVELACDLYLPRTTTGPVDTLPRGQFLSMLVDRACLAADVATQKPSASPRERTQLSNTLHAAFDADPLEDGMDHPAEQIIARAMQSTEDQHLLDWLRAFSLDAAQPGFAASVLRCLGRYQHPGTASWRTGLVREGLELDDVEIRDAAVQAAESWGSSDVVDVLAAHDEPEPWLRDYIRDVVNDLKH